MNKRSQAMLRDFATELPAPDEPDYDEIGTPFQYACSMVADHNATHEIFVLDFRTAYIQAPDHRWYEVAWVFRPLDGPIDGGGDVITCWWQETSCPSCEGYGYIELFHPSTDALTGHSPCPETHPTCGKCEACRWVIKNGAYDEVTGKLSRPACTGPPPPVSLVKAHYCDDPYHCPPF